MRIVCREISLIPPASEQSAALGSPPVHSLLVNYLRGVHQKFTQPSLMRWLYSCRFMGCEVHSVFSFQGVDRLFFLCLSFDFFRSPRIRASGSCNRQLTAGSIFRHSVSHLATSRYPRSSGPAFFGGGGGGDIGGGSGGGGGGDRGGGGGAGGRGWERENAAERSPAAASLTP